MIKGKIIKVIGGLFTVETQESEYYSCKARGIFKQKGISLVCGDNVFLDRENGEFFIKECEKRKNLLIRPPLANLDIIVFVVSTCEPNPSFLILDKLIAIAEFKKITPVIVVTKIDKKRGDIILENYKNTGIEVVLVDNTKNSVDKRLLDILSGKISAFVGNTGVGKSSLLNTIVPKLELDTNEISKKLGRGKHTTRHCELYKLEKNTYIADTPGFSSLETIKYDVIFKDDLPYCFAEFLEYIGKCKYQDCSHTKEDGCAVLQAVEDGIISKNRHKSYLQMYEEAKVLKKWELK